MADPGHIPGAVYIPNCLAIRLFWTLPNAKQAFNVLHAHYDTPPAFNQPQANRLFPTICTAFTGSGIATRLDSETHLTNAGFRDMRQGTDGFGYGEWVSNNTGVSGRATAEDPPPPQIAFVVSLKTGRSGQANRGRVYLPGFNAAAGDGTGRALQATADDAVDFVEAVSAALQTSGYDAGVAD